MSVGGDRLGRLAPRLPLRGQRAAGGNGLLARLSARIGYRMRTIGLALLLALVAVLVTSSYVRGYERRVQAGAASADVLVAARDIPAGTPGSKLRARGLLRTRAIPRRAVVPGAITGVEQVARLVARQPIYAGEQVTVRRFESATQQGLRGQLTGTTRALRIAGDPNQLLAGILRDGDRVDVLASIGTAGGEAASTVVLRDLLVVQAATDEGGSARDNAAVVLALSDRQAQKLFYAMKNGQWSLLLRPIGRSVNSPGAVDTAATVIGAAG